MPGFGTGSWALSAPLIHPKPHLYPNSRTKHESSTKNSSVSSPSIPTPRTPLCITPLSPSPPFLTDDQTTHLLLAAAHANVSVLDIAHSPAAAAAAHGLPLCLVSSEWWPCRTLGILVLEVAHEGNALDASLWRNGQGSKLWADHHATLDLRAGSNITSWINAFAHGQYITSAFAFLGRRTDRVDLIRAIRASDLGDRTLRGGRGGQAGRALCGRRYGSARTGELGKPADGLHRGQDMLEYPAASRSNGRQGARRGDVEPAKGQGGTCRAVSFSDLDVHVDDFAYDDRLASKAF